jgi:hypothetical protein
MSILIEAVCLVVPRLVLDVSFPGGTDALLAHCIANENVRYAIADAHLVSVSTLDPQSISPLVDQLIDLGIVGSEDGTRAGEFVFVDMLTGPALPCDWLGITLHPHGFAFAELVGYPVCAFETPQGWTLLESWVLSRTDIRDGGPDAIMPLGISDGVETIVDLTSGRLVTGTPERSPVEHVPIDGGLRGAPAADERWMAAHRAFVTHGVPHQILTDTQSIAALFALSDLGPDDSTEYRNAFLRVVIGPAESANTLQCEAILPLRLSSEIAAAVRSLVEYESVERYGWSQFASEIRHDLDTGTMSVRHLCIRNGEESWDDVVERACVESVTRGTVTLIGFAKFSPENREKVHEAREACLRDPNETGNLWDRIEQWLAAQMNAKDEQAREILSEAEAFEEANFSCRRVLSNGEPLRFGRPSSRRNRGPIQLREPAWTSLVRRSRSDSSIWGDPYVLVTPRPPRDPFLLAKHKPKSMGKPKPPAEPKPKPPAKPKPKN